MTALAHCSSSSASRKPDLGIDHSKRRRWPQADSASGTATDQEIAIGRKTDFADHPSVPSQFQGTLMVDAGEQGERMPSSYHRRTR